MKHTHVRLRSGHVLARHRHLTHRAQARQQNEPTHVLAQALLDPQGMLGLRRLCQDILNVGRASDHEIIGRIARLVSRGELYLGLNPDGRITAAELHRLFPGGDGSYMDKVAEDLNVDIAAYGLDTPLRKAHFFAQLREESGDKLDRASESFNYASAGLLKTFSYYRGHTAEAEADGRSVDPRTHRTLRAAAEQTIANKVYAGKLGNGNIDSGDGWKFRGRGLIQITGRSNYGMISRQYYKTYGEAVDFLEKPDLVAEFPYSLRSAVCFWLAHGLELKADIGASDATVDSITEVVNKHTDSYVKRQGHFHAAYGIFK